MDPTTLTLGGVFIDGLATSLHCAGMCGLLTCGLGIAGQGSSKIASIGVYHATRLLGYAIAGMIAGYLGGLLGIEKYFSGFIWIPLMLIVLLIAITFGLDNKIATIPGLGKVVLFIKTKTLSFPPITRAAFIGISTPLLPCGPLYAVIAIALASGSAIRGTEIMLAFGLGPIPAIWAVQAGSVWINRKLGAKGFIVARRAIAATAALSLAWHFTALNPNRCEETGAAACQCELDLSNAGE